MDDSQRKTIREVIIWRLLSLNIRKFRSELAIVLTVTANFKNVPVIGEMPMRHFYSKTSIIIPYS